MKNRIIILTFVLVCAGLQSCVKEKLESMYNSQETKIDQYIEKNRYIKRNTQVVSKDPETGEIIYEADGITPVMKDTTVTDTLAVHYNGGASRLVTKEGEGEIVGEGGTVAFYYAGYVFSGSLSNSNLFATNHRETAEAAGWTLTDEQDDITTIGLNGADLTDGLRNGLIGVRAGEECQILFSGKYGFGRKGVGTVPANSAVGYKIWVESISND